MFVEVIMAVGESNSSMGNAEFHWQSHISCPEYKFAAKCGRRSNVM